jgi:hypothetical protein
VLFFIAAVDDQGLCRFPSGPPQRPLNLDEEFFTGKHIDGTAPLDTLLLGHPDQDSLGLCRLGGQLRFAVGRRRDPSDRQRRGQSERGRPTQIHSSFQHERPPGPSCSAGIV